MRTACQVRAFRDRRYEYKGLNKVWKGKHEAAKAEGNPLKIQEAADMWVTGFDVVSYMCSRGSCCCCVAWLCLWLTLGLLGAVAVLVQRRC